MEQLTGKDAELLAKIEQHYAGTGFPLSLGESAELMGMSKGSVIADMVKRLEAANVIEYAEHRKFYRPTRWRELVAGQMPDANATPEFEALQKENEELRRKLAAKPKGKAATNADLERIREQNRNRQAAFKQRKREAAAKK